MKLTVDKFTALRALRVFRREGRVLSDERLDLPVVDPAPRKRWTPSSFPAERLGLLEPPSPERPIDVVVSTAGSRIRGPYVSCSVRSSLPPGSFADLGDGIFAPSPELLFCELAEVMPLETHALLGYELCGTYARSPTDSRLGDVVYGLLPVTSVEKIEDYLKEMGQRRSVLLARRSLGFVADNAWSPIEAIIALMTCLSAQHRGYGIGTVQLNARQGTAPELVTLGCKDSRVPDIEIVGTHVGFNYDSAGHFDLDSIVEAARAGDPGTAVSSVREKYVDDLRRNRELAAQGRIILPVTKEDLFAPGGLDAVMMEAAMLVQELDGGCMLSDMRALLSSFYAKERQRLIWALLPWSKGADYARELGLSPG